MNTPIQEARNALSRTVAQSARDNDGWPGEADTSVNNASRRVVEAMAEQHGEAWVGKINLYDADRAKNGGTRDGIMCLWNGEPVLNFEYAFVAPRFDEQLVQLIFDRDVGPYTSSSDDYAKITAIFERLTEIGGVHLFWT
jgi:hypothetical protein